MPRYLLTPAADGDIDGIWRYVWEHAPNAADELVAKAYRAFDLLTDNPGMGKVRTELRGEPRSFPMTGSGKVQKFMLRDWFVAGDYEDTTS